MGESMDDITRFYIARDKELNMVIKDRQNELIQISNLEDANYMLNKLQDEIDNLKHYFLISQQKDDNGGFHVWQTPPLRPGQRITTKTYGSDPK